MSLAMVLQVRSVDFEMNAEYTGIPSAKALT